MIETFVVARVAEEGRETRARGDERCNLSKSFSTFKLLKRLVIFYAHISFYLYVLARSLSRLVKIVLLVKENF